jgi:ABC-type uncharacterized transport system substrate-binding protein
MRRRDIVLLAGATFALPRFAAAQQPGGVRHIGYLTPATGSPEDALGVAQTRGLVEGLRDLGWFDGRNISIEHRFSGSGREKIRTNARELVALNPDVIFCVGGPALAALLAETRTVPIVFVHVNDPVGAGFVSSLARPGGNATGIAVGEAPIAGKWLQLLKEITPPLTRVLVLPEADSTPQQLLAQIIAAAAPPLGLTPVIAPIREATDYDREMAAFSREPGGGLVVLPNAVVNNDQQRFHALAAQYHLPAVYSYPVNVHMGGLISYGPDPVALIHEATRYIDKVLHGAQPADLPVQQPARFVLAVNLKTAKALGLTVPQSILARADEVIE